ncbi:MAG: signal peptidase I [Coriobacteriia bacterium]|nr:signal peptidase I [Coriobacteriia bacterium]
MKALTRTLYAIEVVFLAALVLALVGGMPFGVSPYIVGSGSMEPAIPQGSLVYIKHNVDTSSLQVGDIIAFQHRQTDPVVTHRITGIDPQTGRYATKGDANTAQDAEETSPDQVIGKALFSIPLAGCLLADHKNALIAAGLALVGINLVLSSRKQKYSPFRKGTYHG